MGLNGGGEGVWREDLFDQVGLLRRFRGAMGLGELVLTLSLCLEMEREQKGHQRSFLAVRSVQPALERQFSCLLYFEARFLIPDQGLVSETFYTFCICTYSVYQLYLFVKLAVKTDLRLRLGLNLNVTRQPQDALQSRGFIFTFLISSHR